MDLEAVTKRVVTYTGLGLTGILLACGAQAGPIPPTALPTTPTPEPTPTPLPTNTPVPTEGPFSEINVMFPRAFVVGDSFPKALENRGGAPVGGDSNGFATAAEMFGYSDTEFFVRAGHDAAGGLMLAVGETEFRQNQPNPPVFPFLSRPLSSLLQQPELFGDDRNAGDYPMASFRIAPQAAGGNFTFISTDKDGNIKRTQTKLTIKAGDHLHILGKGGPSLGESGLGDSFFVAITQRNSSGKLEGHMLRLTTEQLQRLLMGQTGELQFNANQNSIVVINNNNGKTTETYYPLALIETISVKDEVNKQLAAIAAPTPTPSNTPKPTAKPTDKPQNTPAPPTKEPTKVAVEPTAQPTSEPTTNPNTNGETGIEKYRKMSQEELKAIAEKSQRLWKIRSQPGSPGGELPLNTEIDQQPDQLGIVYSYNNGIVLDKPYYVEMTTPGLPELEDGPNSEYKFTAVLVPVLFQGTNGEYIVEPVLMHDNFIVNHTIFSNHTEPAAPGGSTKTSVAELIDMLTLNTQHRFDIIVQTDYNRAIETIRRMSGDTTGAKTRSSLIQNSAPNVHVFFEALNQGNIEKAKKVPFLGPVNVVRINTP